MAHLPDHPQLRTDLDCIARQTAGALRRAGVRSELARSSARCTSLLLVVPGLYVLVQLLRLVTGGTPEPMEALPLAAATLAVPGAFLVLAWSRAWLRRIERRESLGLCDAELALQDRLVTADEFLERSERTGFMSAALEDTVEYARRARESRFAVAVAPLPRIRFWGPLAAVSLFGLSLWLASVGIEGAGRQEVVAVAPSIAEPGQEVGSDEGGRPDRDPADVAEPRQASGQREGPGQPAGLVPPQQNLEGASAGSGASPAGPSRVPSLAVGTPANGGASSEGSGEGEESRNEQQVRPREGNPSGVARTGDETGEATGSGAGGGAGEDPMSGEWNSRRQAGALEEEGTDEQAEVREEREGQDARGGVQPNLRDRRPSASRELQMGLGSDPNPDANGRGGPSEPKKSRGVASLVLGVPIVDLVAGQPNPGRTVVTRERMDPDREDAGVQPAQARTPGSGPMGHVPHPELTPWMRDLVRRYFLTLRTEGRSEREGSG